MSDKKGVTQTLSPTRLILRLLHAGVKRSGSLLRGVGVGHEHPHWEARAALCATCPLCVVEKRHAYCGKPFLRKIEREEATEGCGCPIVDKAKDPAEHCPRNAIFDASRKTDPATCDCVWCTQLRSRRA